MSVVVYTHLAISLLFSSLLFSSLLFSSLLFSSIIINRYTEKGNYEYILPSYYIACFAQPDQTLPYYTSDHN